MSKTTTRSFVVALAITLVAAACSSAEDPGDPEAFCELLRSGVGLSAGGVDGLEQLEVTAPPDIRPTVRRLANTARSLDEIPDQDLDELFSAAFDPEAVEVRAELRQYAVDECGSSPIELDGPLESPDDATAAEAQLIEYLTTNFGTTAWAGEVDVIAVFAFGRLDSFVVEFHNEPTTPDDPLAACNAVAVYLYEIQGGSGEVVVNRDTALLASRSGPGAQCVRP